MSRQTRRTFLKQAAATAGIATGIVVAPSGRVLGANDKIRIGVAGIHGRGSSHINEFAKMDGVDVTYLIDPDSRLFEGRTAQVKKNGGNTPKCVQDIRDALEDPDLDAVSVATCNHWHSLITFWACQAGKDVYVEKPISHNAFEGRQCVKAAEKNGCIVQHGTQSRGSDGWVKTVAAVASGKYGKLLVSKAYASKNRWSIGFKEDKDPPAEVDYNLWLGPAQEVPYNENLVHYNWHWNWDFGNGEIGNQGVHQMDIARWGIPGATLPKSAFSIGGRWVNSTEGHPPFTDQGETPNMQVTVFDFGGPLLIFEVCGLNNKTVLAEGGKKFSPKVDNEFYLEEGAIIKGKFYPKGKSQGESIDVEYEGRSQGNVFQNFIACVRSRKREDLYADVLDAHYSAALCHLGNISYRLGEEVSGTTEPALPDCEHSRASWDYLQENLKGALGLDLSKSTYQHGRQLEFDAKAEKFVGSSEANALLTRDYREPFVVTEKV